MIIHCECGVVIEENDIPQGSIKFFQVICPECEKEYKGYYINQQEVFVLGDMTGEKYKMQGWKYPHRMFVKFLESEYGQLDKRLRDRINWGCNCHFRNDKEAWDVLNEMFDYVLCLYYKDEEV